MAPACPAGYQGDNGTNALQRQLPENLQKIIDDEERRAKTKGISKEQELFALETGTGTSTKSKPSSSADPKPSGFNSGGSTSTDSSSGGFLGDVKARFQEALADAQAAEEAKQKDRAEASNRTIDVKAQDVTPKATPNKGKSNRSSSQKSSKSASKKKRKNRSKRR